MASGSGESVVRNDLFFRGASLAVNDLDAGRGEPPGVIMMRYLFNRNRKLRSIKCFACVFFVPNRCWLVCFRFWFRV